MIKRAITLCATCLLLFTTANAQCAMENKAFQGGETLIYDLYFNWKFIWLKVGNATMITRKSLYNGIPGYKSSLLTRGNKTADKLFIMRDTLSSIVTNDLVPLYYRKGAEEGSQYRVDEVWYSYPDGIATLKQRYQNAKGKISHCTYQNADECIVDMMSMFLRARQLDASNWKKGHKIHFLMADGDDVVPQVLLYRGKENFTMESTGVTYRCLVLSFVEPDEETKEEKEVITFYVTDDDNHLPVRLDLNLNFGTAKAFLSAKSGVRHPFNSIVKGKKKSTSSK